MAFKYEVNGHVIEFEQEPTEQDIDEAASQLGQSPAPTSNKQGIDFGQAANAAGRAIMSPSPTDFVQGGGNPVIAAGMAGMGDIYGQAKEGVQTAIPKEVKSTIGSLIQRMPGAIPLLSNMFKKEDVGNVATGVGIDVAAGVGGALMEPLAAKTAVGAIKGADKNITSLLRRISGQSSSDIKLLRQLEAEQGRGFVLNKTKSKPEYVGREISPKSAELARSRVSSMEPEALREIGVTPESTNIAQDVKGKFGLKEFPTKAKADELFDDVINSAPPESRIQPNNLSNAIQELESQGVSLRELKGIKSSITGSPSTTEAIQSGKGAGQRLNGLSPDEYRNLRTYLNNLTDSGSNPFFQKLKSALDADAEAVIPKLSEAKGVFQVSRELPKAETYLDKTKLPEEMSRRLESASQPENVNVRESLNRLLGPDGESLVADAQAQRLSKGLYAPSNLSTRPMGNVNDILDLIKLPGRFIQRGYEKGRSLMMSPSKAPVKAPIQQVASSQPSVSTNVVTPTEKEMSIQDMYKRVSEYKPKNITPLSEESIKIAQEAEIKRAIARGELPYQPQGKGAPSRVLDESNYSPPFVEERVPINPDDYLPPPVGEKKLSGADKFYKESPYAGGASRYQGYFPQKQIPKNTQDPYGTPYKDRTAFIKERAQMMKDLAKRRKKSG